MSYIQVQYFHTPAGELILGVYDNQLCMADWRYRKTRKSIDARLQKGLSVTYIEEDTAVLQQARQELDEYFNRQRQNFNIPLLMVGTDFQKQVWRELIDIPYGTTSSYLVLSKSIGNEKAVRAVASANGANAISIMIPCHRIIGSDGSLVGYAGGLPAKRKLLALEQSG
ncbi:methylated-DNA--[protein]-cysteine S-methyltransferase [Ghiorsea bivora]|uniref:methylated-DNA--[protein]-cysteine S-methyltransferase n=1 Tax=Ghiorsea bivora TaxID=1485545 RepID=UPI00056F03C9|nr:methylated-DNA--[protein]-cysteine S-methyltransferase [Ghiorsea bivora]